MERKAFTPSFIAPTEPWTNTAARTRISRSRRGAGTWAVNSPSHRPWPA